MSSRVKEYGITVVAAVLVALATRVFVIEAYRIPASTMKPTLEPGDTLFVGKFAYGIRLPYLGTEVYPGDLPKYGDVVVYTQVGDPPRDSIKRVVALPGDKAEIHDGRLLVNGRDLAEGVPKDKPCGEEKPPTGHPYSVCWETPLLDNFGPVTVPPESVLLISDARVQPTEHRIAPLAIVPRTSLRGRALWVWLSIQPSSEGGKGALFSRIRFERMFRRI